MVIFEICDGDIKTDWYFRHGSQLHAKNNYCEYDKAKTSDIKASGLGNSSHEDLHVRMAGE
jgi:hypothetical protein